MSKSEFEVGDKVRTRYAVGEINKGVIGTVIEINCGITYPVRVKLQNKEMAYHEVELELVEKKNSLRKGARVKVTRSFTPRPDAVYTGIVTSVNETGDTISMRNDDNVRTLYFVEGLFGDYKDTIEVIPDPLPTKLNAIIRHSGGTFIHTGTNRWLSLRTQVIYSNSDLEKEPFVVIFDGED